MSSNNSSGNSSGGQTVFIPTFPNGNGWFTIVGGGGGGGGAGFSNKTIEPTTEKKKDKDGCDCKKCREFYPYAEPNQEDGTLVCYKCRIGW